MPPNAPLGLERHRIDVGSAELEVLIGGPSQPDARMICAAHPAETYDESTVSLLSEASGVRVVCINLRGLGGSSPVSSTTSYSLESMVEDLDAVRQRLDLAPWIFWGMSGGGWLGEIYARRHPEALRGLILESVCQCFRERLADPQCLLSPFHAKWRDKLAAGGLIDPSSHAEVGSSHSMEWVEVESVGSVFRRRGGPALLVAPTTISADMRRVMSTLWSMDARKWLRHVKLPTLVMVGTADPLLPLAHARAVHEAIASSTFVAIEGAGHVPTSEHRPEARDAVRALIETVRKRSR